MTSRFRNIVFSAGSMGGLAFVGAWKVLEDHDLISGITGLSGCSIGSVIALLVSIGYTGNELKALSYSLKYNELSDFQILNTLNNLGLETGDKIVHLLEELLERKTGQKRITFAEHYRITGRELWVNSFCVEHDNGSYYSKKDTPEMDVILAVRMSISLPWIMAPVRYKGLTYIDGGFSDPCPVHMFPKEDTLVLRAKNTHSVDLDTHEFIRYTSSLIFSAYRRMHCNLEVTLSEYRTVIIDTGIGAVSLDIGKKDRKRLVDIGYRTMNRWVQENGVQETKMN